MNAAIIVAAGKGTRMGPEVDKLFLEIHGLPVVGHTWQKFDSAPVIAEVILVIRDGMQSIFDELGEKLRVTKPFRLVIGGKERQDSVWNGLEAVSPQPEMVAIHDAARPCVTQSMIEDTLKAAEATGAAVAAHPLTDTIKESTDGKHVLKTLDRSRLWAVQTPQCFRTQIIRNGIEEARRQGLVLTDDTAACELLGISVRLVWCHSPNPKLTRPEDLPVLEALLGGSPRRNLAS